MKRETAFLTRHTTPARNANEHDKQSQQYPDLTVGGVEKAKEKAQTEILDFIKKAPEGAVICISGVSDQARTAQTVEIYEDALASAVYEEDKDDGVEVITKKDVDGLIASSNTERVQQAATQDYDRSLEQIARDVEATPNFEDVIQQIAAYVNGQSPEKKIVVTFPVQLKGLSYGFRERWATKDGGKTEYFSEVLKKHQGDHTKAGLDWLENQGVLTTEDGRTIQGPNPTQVAKEYLESVRRLREFVSQYTDRPISIGGVGHQWDLDAVVTYAASGGKDVTIETFKQVAGNAENPLIGEAELFNLSLSEDGAEVEYRGKKFELGKKG